MIKIMIADDQELIRESLKIILSTQKEFNIISTAVSGKDVIEKVRVEGTRLFFEMAVSDHHEVGMAVLQEAEEGTAGGGGL